MKSMVAPGDDLFISVNLTSMIDAKNWVCCRKCSLSWIKSSCICLLSYSWGISDSKDKAYEQDLRHGYCARWESWGKPEQLTTTHAWYKIELRKPCSLKPDSEVEQCSPVREKGLVWSCRWPCPHLDSLPPCWVQLLSVKQWQRWRAKIFRWNRPRMFPIYRSAGPCKSLIRCDWSMIMWQPKC